VRLALGSLCRDHHLLLLFFFGFASSSFKLPGLHSCGRYAAVRRPLRSPTNCARAHRASWPLPPLLASLSSCLRGRLSSPRDVVDPSRNRKDLECSGHNLPGASLASRRLPSKDTFLGIPVSRLSGGWHQPQVCSYRAALLEAVGVFQGEHEGQSREWPDPLDPAQELRFGVALL
jgi:hypothetical protein